MKKKSSESYFKKIKTSRGTLSILVTHKCRFIKNLKRVPTLNLTLSPLDGAVHLVHAIAIILAANQRTKALLSCNINLLLHSEMEVITNSSNQRRKLNLFLELAIDHHKKQPMIIKSLLTNLS